MNGFSETCLIFIQTSYRIIDPKQRFKLAKLLIAGKSYLTGEISSRYTLILL